MVCGTHLSPTIADPTSPMFHFLANNRDELIARCKAKVAARTRGAASSEQLSNGVPSGDTPMAKVS
jgi:hypothetical protein